MTGAQCLSSSNGRCPLGPSSWLAQNNNVYQVALFNINIFQVSIFIKYLHSSNVYQQCLSLVVMTDVPWVPIGWHNTKGLPCLGRTSNTSLRILSIYDGGKG